MTPNTSGKLRLTPKFTPELINMTLLGPGVIAEDKANKNTEIANSMLMVVTHWFRLIGT